MIILKTPWAIFLAPDNGVLSYIIDELEPPLSRSQSVITTELVQRKIPKSAKAIAITNHYYWNHPPKYNFS